MEFLRIFIVHSNITRSPPSGTCNILFHLVNVHFNAFFLSFKTRVRHEEKVNIVVIYFVIFAVFI